MKSFRFLYLAIAVIALSVSACKDDHDHLDPLEGLTKYSEAYATGAGIKVEVYAAEAPFMGYNFLHFYVTDSVSGDPVEHATINIVPMMDMGMMMHSAPVENPDDTHHHDGVYPAQVVFIMSSMGGDWTLQVTVEDEDNPRTGTAVLDMTVVEPTHARMVSFTSTVDSSRVFVSLVKPMDPKTGVNDFEIAVHKRASMMSFPADERFTIDMEPTMPSMGHGSPNNVNPVLTTKGHYAGKVNFTMTGLWQVDLDFIEGANTHYTNLPFTIEF
jgi:hypothetical protein